MQAALAPLGSTKICKLTLLSNFRRTWSSCMLSKLPLWWYMVTPFSDTQAIMVGYTSIHFPLYPHSIPIVDGSTHHFQIVYSIHIHPYHIIISSRWLYTDTDIIYIYHIYIYIPLHHHHTTIISGLNPIAINDDEWPLCVRNAQFQEVRREGFHAWRRICMGMDQY